MTPQTPIRSPRLKDSCSRRASPNETGRADTRDQSDPIFRCSDDGLLRYRGTVHDRSLFVGLRKTFAQEPSAYAREFENQIDAALAKHDRIHSEDNAA